MARRHGVVYVIGVGSVVCREGKQYTHRVVKIPVLAYRVIVYVYRDLERKIGRGVEGESCSD